MMKAICGAQDGRRFPAEHKDDKEMQRMMRLAAGWAFGLAAGMAAAQNIRSVAVDYTYFGRETGHAFQIDEDIFIAPVLARKWGWIVETRLQDADITAEGRSLRLGVKVIEGRPMINLRHAVQQLGALADWSADQSTYRVRGWVRSVLATPEGVRIDSTLAVQPRAWRLADPPRLILDLKGGAMAPNTLSGLPAGWRVGRFDDATFRFVCEHPEMALQPTPPLAVGRSVSLALRSVNPTAAGLADPEPAPQTRPSGTEGSRQGGRNDRPASPPAVVEIAQLPAAASDQLQFRFPIASGTPGAPTVSVIDAQTLRLVIPRAQTKAPGDFGGLDGSHFAGAQIGNRGADIAATFRFRRPMSFRLRTEAKEIVFTAIVPPGAGGSLRGKKIVIDAGHGAHDPGANRGPHMEKNYALRVASLLKAALEAKGAQVILTRASDVYVGLTERPKMARDAGADLFISVHFNSSGRENSVSGTMTFYHLSDPDDMILAHCIHPELIAVSGLPDKGALSDRRIYQSGFAVLRGAPMPAVLLELAFINHERDRAQIVRPEWQKAMADAAARGIQRFIEGGN
jgi:N-acetylmuramoyl-L-alanine amidase